MVKKSQRIWIIFIGLFIALVAAFAVPKTEDREVHAANTFNESDANPRISSVSDLTSFYSASAGGNDFSGKTVTLNADIDCADTFMIGSSTTEFKGVFDGNGYTVKNLHLSSTGFINKATKDSNYSVGSSGVIKNLTLENFSLNNSSTNNVGGICGYLTNGQIINCKVKGGSITGGENTGGICGYVYSETYGGSRGLIRECGCTANIIGDTSVGGIIGCSRCADVNFCNYGKIDSTVNSNATVKQKSDSKRNSDVGGIVGYANNPANNENYITAIQWCANYGTVTSDKSGSTRIGGIIGCNTQYRSKVYHCCNLGAISGTYAVGGIMGYDGYAQGTIHSCFNAGTVTLKSDGANWGQIIGHRACSDFHIYNCYFDVDVNAEGGSGNGNIAYDKSQGLDVSGWPREDFSSGWVATYLNGNYDTTEMIGSQTSGGYNWQQSLDNGIGPDTYPTPSPTSTDYSYQRCPRGMVYLGYWCKSSTQSYSNYQLHSSPNVDHPGYNNGFCTKCGKYQACSGSGTSASPYLIDNAGKLYWFSAVVNNDLNKCAVSPGSRNVSACGKLTGNVNLNLTSLSIPNKPTSWSPIGRYASGDRNNGYPSSYRGKFDGDNYTISNMSISGAGTQYRGLFGQVYYTTTDQCEIKNVKLKDANVTCGDYGGLICGYSTGANITNCHTIKSDGGTCRIEGNASYIGGICGYSELLTNGGVTTGHVTNCSNAAAVTSSKIYVGGIAGATSGNITSCSNTANVTSSYSAGADACVGGVVGGMSGAITVSKCYNTGTVESTANKSCIGGISGIAGASNFTITDCYNQGTVSGRDGIGGMLGYNGGNDYVGIISNCYNSSAITKTSTNSGNILGNDNAGSNVVAVTNCYYNQTVNTTGATGGGKSGTPKTAAEFASGEVAWLLNGSTSTGDLAWYQSIDNQLSPHDAYPLLESERGTIYYGYKDCITQGYSNTELPTTGGDHVFDNGFCTVCGKYQACSGSGTSASPYLIDNAGKLYWFSAVVNNNLDKCEGTPTQNTAANGKLTANITIPEKDPLNNSLLWNPIGNASNKYSGTFDGYNNVISSMTVNTVNINNDYAGFFGYTHNATIKNIGIINSSINTTSSGGGMYAGGLIGYMSGGSISNTYSTSTVTAIDNTPGTTDYQSGTGGFIGHATNFASIENCYTTGNVTLTSTYKGTVAGFIGFIHNQSNTDCNIRKCYATGNVTHNVNSTTGAAYTGGFVGDAWAQASGSTIPFENCYAHGNCTVNKSTSNAITINVGGFGANGGVATNCYAKGNITCSCSGSNTYNVGRFGNVTSATNSYYLENSSVTDVGNLITKGTAKTAAEFSSGEVTYLLNGSTSTGDLAWYQSVDNGLSPYDSYPVFDSARGIVYKGYVSCIEQGYSNTELPTTDGSHDFTSQSNGFCTRCGKYQDCGYDTTLSTDTIGTIDNPYQISNAGQLYWFKSVYTNSMANCVNPPATGNSSICGILTNDIIDNSNALAGNDRRMWSVPGTYTGIFDGDGHTISGIYQYVSSGVLTMGLFRTLTGATVKNLGVINSYVSYYWRGSGGNLRVGGLAGVINGGSLVENCYVDNMTVQVNTTNPGYPLIGSLISESYGNSTIKDCHATNCNVSCRKWNNNCRIAALCGSLNNSHAINCYAEDNTVTVTEANADIQIGGLCGASFAGSTMTKCYAKNNIISSVSSNASAKIYTGQLVGLINNAGVTTDCYAIGDNVTVNGVPNTKYGGVFAGYNDSQVTDCYAVGNITIGGSGANNYGGAFVGYSNGQVANCYYQDTNLVTNNVTNEDASFTDSTGNISGAYSKTAAEFASGEVAWRLNGSLTSAQIESSDTLAWKQNVVSSEAGIDAYPVFDNHAKVYPGYECGDNDASNPTHFKNFSAYDGTEGIYPVATSHDFEGANGFCTRCGVYQAPTVGDGTAQDPYLIDNAGKLYWFACVVNGDTSKCEGSPTGNAAACGTLTGNVDLDLTSLSVPDKPTSWSPIGNNTTPYTGTFDGDECTIHNLTINASGTDYQGLFGKSSGTIQNITLEDANITGGAYTGAVCGYVGAGTVSNCRTVKSENGTCFVTGGYSTSGIVGYTLANITSCRNEATITSSSGYVGGICGLLGSGANITNCANTGQVGNGPNCGGIVGTIGSSSIISNCWNSGLIDSNDNNGGGIAGLSSAGTIINCYNTGTVGRAGGTPKLTGGILGSTGNGNPGPSVINCYNAGVIYHTKNWGHIIGGGTGGAVENCYYNREVLAAVGNKLNGTAKTAAEFANFNVKDLLQTYVDEHTTPSNPLSSWVQAEIKPEFGWDNHDLVANVSWGDMKFVYTPPSSSEPTGSWSIDTDENKITFENHSNGAKLRYNDTYGNITGVTGVTETFTHENGDWTYQGNTWPMVESPDMSAGVTSETDKSVRNSWLTIAGTISGIDLNNYIGKANATPIGQITMTISG